jgi:hypothetical protein
MMTNQPTNPAYYVDRCINNINPLTLSSLGLNIVSEFNLDNLTEFGGESTNDLKDILAEKDETVEEDLKPDAK